MGHHSPSHQWGMHRRSFFLPTPPWAMEDSINLSPKVLHKHLLFHRQAREARAHRLRLQGPRSLSTPLHHKLSSQTSPLYRVCLCYLCLWARILFDSGASHSSIVTSCVKELGLEVETLEKSLHVTSPLGIRVRVDMICQDCELEIFGILLTVDLAVMDMSEFDVILG